MKNNYIKEHIIVTTPYSYHPVASVGYTIITVLLIVEIIRAIKIISSFFIDE